MRLAGQSHLLRVIPGNGLVPEYGAVYHGLELPEVGSEGSERRADVVVRVPEGSEQQMVRADAVVAGAHSLVLRVGEDRGQLCRNLQFHTCKNSVFIGFFC